MLGGANPAERRGRLIGGRPVGADAVAGGLAPQGEPELPLRPRLDAVEGIMHALSGLLLAAGGDAGGEVGDGLSGAAHVRSSRRAAGRRRGGRRRGRGRRGEQAVVELGRQLKTREASGVAGCRGAGPGRRDQAALIALSASSACRMSSPTSVSSDVSG